MLALEMHATPVSSLKSNFFFCLGKPYFSKLFNRIKELFFLYHMFFLYDFAAKTVSNFLFLIIFLIQLSIISLCLGSF